MARNRKLKKLKKSPCYAMFVYEQGYESIARQKIAELVKADELHITPDNLKAIPAEGDQKENIIWLNFVQS